MEGDWLIELEGVDVTHPDVTDAVLAQGVEWRIRRGEFWVVGGPPGGGTSSLLATAAGLNRPGGGTVRMFGKNLMEATEQERIEWRQWIGFVFEDGGRLLTHLTVAENVALPVRYHRAVDETEIAALVDSWLTRTELSEYAEAMPSRLSPRLQQRLALARAMITPKAILFVDKPPVGHSRDARWWREQLSGLAAQDMSVVVSSNDFAMWRDVAKQFALLQDGRFSVIGGPEQVRTITDAPWQDYITVN